MYGNHKRLLEAIGRNLSVNAENFLSICTDISSTPLALPMSKSLVAFITSLEVTELNTKDEPEEQTFNYLERLDTHDLGRLVTISLTELTKKLFSVSAKHRAVS